ncbi:MAG: DciA family protein [Rhodovibrionaceae bacterium]|nr:DciA family protein [Rhodovibrionaceae bacterium]
MADTLRDKTKASARPGGADKRYVGGPRPLAASLRPVASRALGQALGKRALAERGLIAEWVDIVGGEVAAHCLPRKLSFPRRAERREGVLTLRVEPGWALELQHLSPQLIERINGYFGYRAVAQLKFQQAPVSRAPALDRKAPRALGQDEQAALQKRTSGLSDRRLGEALVRLGRNVLGRQ